MQDIAHSDKRIPVAGSYFDGTVEEGQFKAIGHGYLHGLLIRHARLEADHAVLDIGSGNGKLAWALTEWRGDKGGYRGFDVVRDGIDACRAAYTRYSSVKFDHADIYSDFYNPNAETRAEDYVFPYDDDVFDIAFAGSLFTHIQPAIAGNYLRETARVLKPGGRLLMTCTLVNEHNNGVPAASAIRQRNYMRASAYHHVLDFDAPSKGVALDESHARRLVSDAGLIVSAMLFGTWSAGEAVTPTFQDVIVALKPSA